MPPDVIRVICPSLKCRAILSVPYKTRGQDVRCCVCGMRIRVPGTPRQESSPASEAPSAAKHADKQKPAASKP